MRLRSLTEYATALASRRVSPAELLHRAAERNRALDEGPRPVRAFLSTLLDGEEAGTVRTEARGVRPAEGGSPLAGIPVAVKDNICTEALPTTCGSRILERYRSPYAATAVRRLTAAGARIFGKTNLDEFAMGSSTENSAFGPTRNPVDRARVPGGSSGGSAAAVAAGVVPAALGSSTGGSVRQPAALCGVVGVKPTYGRVSRYGLVAFASSLDQIGVVAGTVRDAAVVLEAICGVDPFDATSQDRPPPRAAVLDEVLLADQVIGVPREYVDECPDSGVIGLFEALLQTAAHAGAEVREISLPSTRAAIPCYYVIAPAEASSNLARFDGVRYGLRVPGVADVRSLYEESRGQGFGTEVKRRILMGTYALSAGYYDAYYLRAQRMRAEIAREMYRALDEGVDAILAPTTPTPAFKLGERTKDPWDMYRADLFTVSANLAGVPAVSFPIGLAGHLPVGGQLMCRAWEEERMLGIAARLEQAVGFAHPLAEGGPP
ncbi:MAG: Asp-tRNA(Asn)/Glu-tRNA(Gln) amidotransferase subunit GatA [Gemmatimonadota bacterium]